MKRNAAVNIRHIIGEVGLFLVDFYDFCTLAFCNFRYGVGRRDKGGGPGNNQCLGRCGELVGLIKGINGNSLPKKNHIGFKQFFTLAFGRDFISFFFSSVLLSTPDAGKGAGISVIFYDLSGAPFLMKIVHILGDNGMKASHLFQLGHPNVGLVGLSIL